MVCALAFGVAAVARDFAPLFFGQSFAVSGELMIPLAFTLIAIGFANVIRTQRILPNGQAPIFVKSVSAGAVINLLSNALLIPSMGARGAVAGTLLAEFAVPVVQWIILRHALPYGRYVRHLAVYSLLGLVMLLAVRLTARLLPLAGWAGLAFQVAVGAAVYGALCLAMWHLTKNAAILRLLPGRKKS